MVVGELTTGRRNGLDMVCPNCSGRVTLAAPPAPVHCSGCGGTYALQDGIVLLGEPGMPDDYPEDIQSWLAEIEPRHFWFGQRNRLILATMREALGRLAGKQVLDVGCGTGFVLAALERAGVSAVGLDMHLAGLQIARRRTRGVLICDSATRLPFNAQFDAVMLCDVIEHVSDDIRLLREAGRVARDEGVVIITVPALPRLWTVVDEISGHKRRYTREMLRGAISKAGLEARVVRYFNSLLFPAQVVQRFALNGKSAASIAERMDLLRAALRVPPGPVNALLRGATAVDVPLRRIAPPFGTSLIAVASRA